jgi:hypothetical protein
MIRILLHRCRLRADANRAPRIQHALVASSRQRGQSLVELVVVSLFLVPLFMLIPILGKYINVKQHTIEAARAAAWRATVTPLHRAPDRAIVQNTIRKRFFGNPGDPIVSNGKTLKAKDNIPNPLMVTMSGQHLLKYRDIALSKIENHPSPDHFSKSLSYLNKIEGAVHDATGGLFDLQFPPNPNGYYTAEVTTKVADPRIPNTIIAGSGQYLQPFAHLGLIFKERAVLLTDAWSANGPGKPPSWNHPPAPRSVRKTVGALVPTNALLPANVQVALHKLRDLISLLPFFHSLGDLDIGHLAPDVVPTDRLKKYHGYH